MLTKAMAAEWGPHGVQASAIAPGCMRTEMNQALMDTPSFDAWVRVRAPAYGNGQTLFVDGGFPAVL
jgi:gluconate 5-dehydrogenase